MRVIWHPDAQNRLRQTAVYIQTEYGSRSIVVNRLNKIVYWINGDVIEIVDFWDTRREPKKQAEQVK